MGEEEKDKNEDEDENEKLEEEEEEDSNNNNNQGSRMRGLKGGVWQKPWWLWLWLGSAGVWESKGRERGGGEVAQLLRDLSGT